MSRVSEFVLKPPSTTTILKRSWTSDVGNTVKSAKHWNTCMANKPCKIIAIVFIVIGGIILFWLIGSFLRCMRTGCEGWISFFCWPCQSNNSRQPSQPAAQYFVPQQPQWNSNLAGQGNYYNDSRDRNDYGRVFEEELELETQDFDIEAQKRKSQKKLNQVDNTDNSSWFNYNPFASKNDPPTEHSNTGNSHNQNSSYDEYNPFSKFSQNSNKH